jgi:hypothetical protein
LSCVIEKIDSELYQILDLKSTKKITLSPFSSPIQLVRHEILIMTHLTSSKPVIARGEGPLLNRLSGNQKFVVFHEPIVTGGETPPLPSTLTIRA